MTGGDGKKQTDGFVFARKPEETSFLQFVFNPETGEILGRTPASWVKIIIFYTFYYAFLAGFFTLMLLAFFQTLSDDKPVWENDESIIGSNPGLGFRPSPDNKHIESTLIWFRSGEYNGNWKPWVSRLQQFLNDYDEHDNKTKSRKRDRDLVKQEDCGKLASKQPGRNTICKINKEELFQGDCTLENNFGFESGKPCILIKVNRIYGWDPLPYESTTEKERLPEEVPETIRNKIVENAGKEETKAFNDRIWLDCYGINPADKEHLGAVTYYPDQGFSSNYYPYLNQKGYLSPAVFIQLTNPTRGVMIAVECKAWAENIEHDSMERRGIAHFEVMID